MEEVSLNTKSHVQKKKKKKNAANRLEVILGRHELYYSWNGNLDQTFP